MISCNSSVGEASVIEENVYVAAGCHLNARVLIEEDTFIGSGVVISAGCKIGRRSVIGLNATVTKDVAPECVCAGPAAKLVAKGTASIMTHIDQSRSGARILKSIKKDKGASY